jgi:hypothetical protein
LIADRHDRGDGAGLHTPRAGARWRPAIKSGDEVVGAVGVSGSPGKDDICSQAGIDKVADQFK